MRVERGFPERRGLGDKLTAEGGREAAGHADVVERPGVVVGLNGGARLEKDVSRVDRLFKEKCGHAGLPFTVHDCAVDGSRSAVTGKE